MVDGREIARVDGAKDTAEHSPRRILRSRGDPPPVLPDGRDAVGVREFGPGVAGGTSTAGLNAT
jgi:hypothetical protein